MSRRGQVLVHVLNSEELVCRRFVNLVDQFVGPLKESACQITKNPQVGLLLAFWEESRNLHESLFFELSEKLELVVMGLNEDQVVGDVLLKYAKAFKCLGHYAKFFKSALKILIECKDSDFLGFSVKQRFDLNYVGDPEEQVNSFMEICNCVFKATEKEHADAFKLEKSITELEVTKNEMNEAIEYQKNLEKILEIQALFENAPAFGTIDGSRLFIKEGNAFKTHFLDGLIKPLVLHLFSDILAYSERTSRGKLRLLKKIQLQGCTVEYDLNKKVSLQIKKGEKAYCIFFDDVVDVKLWHSLIKDQIRGLKCENHRLTRTVGRSITKVATIDGVTLFVPTKSPLRHQNSSPSNSRSGSPTADNRLMDSSPTYGDWESDTARSSCWVCQESFSLFNRRHHCRLCGKLVCNYCSKGRRRISRTNRKPQPLKEVDDTKFIESSDDNQGERVCDFCQVHASQNDVPVFGVSLMLIDLDSFSDKKIAAAHELLKTEFAYVSKLVLLNQVFIKPLLDTALSSSEENSIVKVDDSALTIPIPVDTITSEMAAFLGSIESITSLNEDFLAEIEARVMNWNGEIGDILCEWLPLFKLYGQYCKGHAKAANAFKNPALQKYLMQRQNDPRCNGESFSFESLLILPVQRVPQYELLIKNLLKCTSNDDPDAAMLSKALLHVSSSAAYINESIKL